MDSCHWTCKLNVHRSIRLMQALGKVWWVWRGRSLGALQIAESILSSLVSPGRVRVVSDLAKYTYQPILIYIPRSSRGLPG
jgi:hypothetical protein